MKSLPKLIGHSSQFNCYCKFIKKTIYFLLFALVLLKAIICRYVLASALRDLNQSNTITVAPKDCDNSGSVWETGKDLFNFIKKQVLINGETGKVAFDDQGDRINAEYNIANIQQGKQKIVGQYFFNRVTIIRFV